MWSVAHEGTRASGWKAECQHLTGRCAEEGQGEK